MVFEKKVFLLQYLQKEQDNCGVAAGSSVRWVVAVSKTAHNAITVPVLVALVLVRDVASNSPKEPSSPTHHRRQKAPRNCSQTSNYSVNTDNTNKKLY